MLWWALGGRPYETSTDLSTRMARPWRIVGLLGPSSSGLISMSRTAYVRVAPLPCTFAIIVIIISGHCKGRHKLCTVWGAVPTPHARVGGRPSAPKPNCPSACLVGVWGGTCFAGLVIADLRGLGGAPSLVRR